MDGAQLIALLGGPHEDGAGWMAELRASAPTAALLEAFSTVQHPFTRQPLADLLGFRGDPAALNPLLAALDDDDFSVRASVADALGKLFVQDVPLADDAVERAGRALLARFEVERRMPVLTTLAVSLGSVRYAPALPALRAALASDDRALVRCARGAIEWIERGPRRMLGSAQVVAALEAPAPDLPGLLDVTTTATLVDALARAERPLIRRRVVELLGDRCDPAGAGALRSALHDAEPSVRAAAAEALEKILL